MNISGMMRGLLGDAQAADSKSLELKVGQVVKGMVLQVGPDQDAVVNIGGVQVRAQLEAPLKQGEVTMLQVQPESSGDQVVLKPLQASSVQIADTSMGEVLKTVGLEDTSANRLLVQSMHQAGILLDKETVQAFAELTRSAPTQAAAKEIMSAAVIAFQKGLPLTPETVASIRQAVQGPPLHAALQDLAQLITQELDKGPALTSHGRALLENVRDQIGQVRAAAAQVISGAGDSAGADAQPPGEETAAPSSGGMKPETGTGNAATLDQGTLAAGREAAVTGGRAQEGLPAFQPAKEGAAPSGSLPAKPLEAAEPPEQLDGHKPSKPFQAMNAQAQAGLQGRTAGQEPASPGTSSAAQRAGAEAAASGAQMSQTPGEESASAGEGAGRAAGAANSTPQQPPAADGARSSLPPVTGAAATPAATQAAATGAPTRAAAADELLPPNAAVGGTAPLRAEAGMAAAQLQPAGAKAPAAQAPLSPQAVVAAEGLADSAASTAQPETSQPAGPASDGEHMLGRLMKALGVEHERNAFKIMDSSIGAGADGNTAAGQEALKVADTLKSALMQLAQSSEAPQALKEAAQSAIQQITGQQLLLSQERNGMFTHVTLFVPLVHPNGDQTAAVHIQSRKGKNGKLDESNCRLVFDLRMGALGDTMVDVQVVNRIVSLQVHNNEPYTQQLLESSREEITRGLASIGYQFISMKCSPYPQRVTGAEETSGSKAAAISDPGAGKLASLYSQKPYKGVDIRL